jgi:hypothetical protein
MSKRTFESNVNHYEKKQINKMQNESFEKAEEELSFEDDYEDEYGLIFK